ncbi:MAG: biopolymer transporter ExbD [Giesbergeria sp.]|nr:biopolymer transporter ExbD [Giesbergeria sp.]
MPASASRGRGRRTINEINMVPFIDVMLVLLIIFMVTAPMLTPGKIDVPSVGKGAKAPKVFGQVIVQKDGSIQLKTGGNERPVTVQTLGTLAKAWQKDQPDNPPIVISADKGVPYEAVVKAMDALQRAGVQRVGLSVKQGG